MTDFNAREFKDVLNAFAAQLRSMGIEVHNNKVMSAFKKAAEQHTQSVQSMSQTMKHASKTIGDQNQYTQSTFKGINKAYEQYHRGINKASNGFSKLDTAMSGTIRQQASLTSSLIEGIDYSNKAQDKLLDAVYGNIKAFKLISAQANGVISSAWELEKAQSDLAKDIGFFEKSMKDSNGQLAKQIKQAKEQAATDASLLTADQNLLLQLAKKYKLEEANDRAIRGVISSSKQEISALQDMIVKQQRWNKSIEFVQDKFGAFGKLITGALSPLGMVVEGLTLFVSGLKGSWEQMKLVADSGMINQFRQIKKAQFALGISFENATKIFTENTRNLAAIGSGQFINALRTGQSALEKFGLAPEAAAEAISDFTKNAVKGGINVRDQNKLNKAIQNQTQAFAKLRATTGTNMQEFKAMNDEMLNSTSVQEQLNGVSESERMNKINDMMKLRQTFVNMGMSAQTAQKALLSIQDIGKQKVVDRFDQAAKLQQAASIAGLSNAKQLADIYRKGKRASADEQAILQRGVGQMGQVFDQMGMQSFEAENIANVLTENLQGPLTTMLEAGREQKQGASAVGEMSDKMANTLTEFSKVPELMAKALHAEGQLKQVLTDPMLRSLAGLSLVISGGLLMLSNKLLGVLKGFASPFSNMDKHLASTVKNTAENVDVDQKMSKTLSGSESIQKSIDSSVKSISHKDCCNGGSSGSDWESMKKTGKTKTGKKRSRWVSSRKGVKVAATKSVANGFLDMAKLSSSIAPEITAASSEIATVVKTGGKFMAGLGKFAKAIPGIGWTISTVLGSFQVVMDMFNASDILGMQNETASLTQRLAVGVGSAIKFLTFGIFDGPIDQFTKYMATTDWAAKFAPAGVWLQQLGITIGEYFDLFATATSGFLEKSWAKVSGIYQTVVDNVSQAISTASDFIDKVESGAKEYASSAKRYLVESSPKTMELLNKVSDVVSSTMNTLSDKSGEVIDVIGQKIGESMSWFSWENVRKRWNEELGFTDEVSQQIDKKTDATEAAIQQTAEAKRKAVAEASNQAQVQVKEQEKQATAISTAAVDAKAANQTVSSATKAISDSTIDASKKLGIVAANGISAAGIRAEYGAATATTTPGAKVVNSSLLNNTEAANDSTSGTTKDSTVKLSDDTMKALADLLTQLNNTSNVSLEIEKEQLVLLEALVKSNDKALRLANDSFAKEGMDNVFNRNTKLSMMGKF